MRRYYSDKYKLYNLFTSHPIMSSYLEEFQIEKEDLLNTLDYLLSIDNTITENLSNLYYDSENSITNDIIDNVARNYGFNSPTYNPPWKQYIGTNGTNLLEFLYYTLFFYKYSVVENFYEQHIFDFIPEYDREIILKNPKLKLTIEALGKKLDQIEDDIKRVKNFYNIDEIPDELLEYLGQNLAYEKEDVTLNNQSFRELLKNIIEIYKIKGTNYSFSFFFKYLGFNINLKEFYFNRDVSNPEGFPGTDKINPEYYLTTTNPLFETSIDTLTGKPRKPADYLRPTKNLTEWYTEYNELLNKGCNNIVEYMLGKETYNNDGITWHPDPWTYFKTNLIEYSLDPFLNRLQLTASDNETIKKYVKFLSPTYLLTWVNVNLASWVESVEIYDHNYIIELTKILGDPRPNNFILPIFKPGERGVPDHPESEPWIPTNFTPPYKDYEDMEENLFIYDSSSGTLTMDITNFLNRGGIDQIGIQLKLDGTCNLQPFNPQYINKLNLSGQKHICYDTIQVNINGEDYSYNYYPKLPSYFIPQNYTYWLLDNQVHFQWESSNGSSAYNLQVATDYLFNNIIIDEVITTNEYISNKLSNNRYYWRVRVRNNLYVSGDPEPYYGPWSNKNKFIKYIKPFPYDNEIITGQTYFVDIIDNMKVRLKFLWNKIPGAVKYRLSISFNSNMSQLIYIEETAKDFSKKIDLYNNEYWWKVDYLTLSGWETSSNIYHLTVNI